MTVFTQGKRACEGLMSEAPGQRSREGIVISAGAGIIAPMTVLGKKLHSSLAATASASPAGKGTLTLAAPPVGPGAKAGVYKVVIVEPATNAGAFVVEDPSGVIVGNGTVGVAFTGEIKFTLADGATDWAAGDFVTVTVPAGSGEYIPSDVTATDGSQIAAAVNLYGCDATSAAQAVSAIVRDAEVNGNFLTYHASRDQASEKAAAVADLAAAGIIVR
ncbi:head decoration protein [Rhodobacter sphaeroides]|jgi:hypothetical protein|uniref:Head decoration protein n=1 Tax=Cereibacter sphaeroides (strain ATCC 17023 / DSM 158 / JCM 6121 / CCUG 31486 / LMG 2827 / NBRC 12203 / NCIMB 8253 / ATH 2.4.1.) TaxID=272943 RepID=Q3J2S1_CERS4|nr:head decoration protein [Cereibacter sphaeroides]ABA78913.1 hypothetical protein RSP_2757 [Cereibacter sphaeroides 2.4.1]ANS33955.1 hypothetical protein A3858_06775 [Cereibacter sphaeroides]ATN62999.1 hypothetical protein A3857_06770 [Cereibacter sphaeroides]AXC61121.1 head decoration protein [Cereibacter sphaeroides 2.4.1]MVX47916.1 head decoration protein [Cereibacter sphaeroides]